jgi:hypothetical protein
MKTKLMMSALALVMLAGGVASAGPREEAVFAGPFLPVAGAPTPEPALSVTFTGSDGAGAYTPVALRLLFDATSLNAATFASEIEATITPPTGAPVVFAPDGFEFVTLTNEGGTFAFTGVLAGVNPIGTWTVSFEEAFDDAPAGADASVNNVRLSLFAAEPFTAPLAGTVGPLGATGATENVVTVRSTIATASEITWVRIITTEAVTDADTSYLDVDTEGTATGVPETLGGLQDTFIGVYDGSTSLLRAVDDDSGTGFRSMLTFGNEANPRPAIAAVAPAAPAFARDGFNGSLPAGTHYLAVSTFEPTFGPGYAATGPANRTAVGERVINVRTTMALPAACASRANVAGANQSTTPDATLTADDIIVFLGWFFGATTGAPVAGNPASPTNLLADVSGANQNASAPDGVLTADDIIVFLGFYFAGCP